MNPVPQNQLAIEARDWVMRLQDPGFADWDSFTRWLERDPACLGAYEAALDADAEVAQLFAVPEAPVIETVVTPLRQRRGGLWFAGGAMAAAIAGVIAWSSFDTAPSLQEIATRPGEHRTLELADGSHVQMNGGTRIQFDPADARRVALLEGEALFEVDHDPRHPFEVTAGKVRLLDAGTVFNVVQDAERTSVAVAEGAVVYEPGPDQVRLDPGQALEVEAGGEPRLSRVEAKQVGSWRSGQLVYWDVGLKRIARDLERNLGVRVAVADGAARIRFSGILVIEGPPETVMERISPLVGVPIVKRGDDWVMGQAGSSKR